MYIPAGLTNPAFTEGGTEGGLRLLSVLGGCVVPWVGGDGLPPA
jgi:hypothetical protein